jgi:hypothetical protein
MVRIGDQLAGSKMTAITPLYLWPARRTFVLLLTIFLTGFRGLAQSAYEPGQSYFGRSNYVEYIAGDMPLIISAPHGGTLKPGDLPDRKTGEFTHDDQVEEMARTLQQVLHQCFGHYPHIIICRVERRKVDCNREIEEGAGTQPGARQAWTDFQRFIEIARSNALANTGKGFYIDLHGQSHAIKRVELGYCLTGSQLTNVDSVLNGPAYANRSSIRNLAQRTGLPLADLLRGTNSFGALLAARGYPAVPSPAMPDPGRGNPYFDGGYNARQHSSAHGGAIDGLQMELNLKGVRDTAINRTNFSRSLAQVLDAYFTAYYSLDLKTVAASGSR